MSHLDGGSKLLVSPERALQSPCGADNEFQINRSANAHKENGVPRRSKMREMFVVFAQRKSASCVLSALDPNASRVLRQLVRSMLSVFGCWSATRCSNSRIGQIAWRDLAFR
jgi:hypothetical protein